MFVRGGMNRYYFILGLFISMRDSVEFTRRARSPEKAWRSAYTNPKLPAQAQITRKFIGWW